MIGISSTYIEALKPFAAENSFMCSSHHAAPRASAVPGNSWPARKSSSWAKTAASHQHPQISGSFFVAGGNSSRALNLRTAGPGDRFRAVPINRRTIRIAPFNRVPPHRRPPIRRTSGENQRRHAGSWAKRTQRVLVEGKTSSDDLLAVWNFLYRQIDRRAISLRF